MDEGLENRMRSRIAALEYRAKLDAQLAEKRAREMAAKRKEQEEDIRRLRAGTGKLGMLSASPVNGSPKQRSPVGPRVAVPDDGSVRFTTSHLASGGYAAAASHLLQPAAAAVDVVWAAGPTP